MAERNGLEIDKDYPASQMPRFPYVSVVLVVRSGDKAAFLPKLKKQNCNQPFEIIVVEGGNRSQARNLGIARSKAPLISFIDADCEASSHWLTSITTALPSGQIVAGVGGVSDNLNSSSKLEKAINGVFSMYIGNLDSPSLISRPDDLRYYVKAISGHNCLYRRSALIEVNGFDERFELNEDTDICARLREKGYKLLLDRKIIVHHKRRENVRRFIGQFFWYGIGRSRSMLTSRRNVDGRIFGLFLTAMFIALVSLVSPVLFLVALLGYFLLILSNSFLSAGKIKSIRLFPVMLSLCILEHFSYLMGLLLGFFLGPWKEGKKRELMQVERSLVSPLDFIREDGSATLGMTRLQSLDQSTSEPSSTNNELN